MKGEGVGREMWYGGWGAYPIDLNIPWCMITPPNIDVYVDYYYTLTFYASKASFNEPVMSSMTCLPS